MKKRNLFVSVMALTVATASAHVSAASTVKVGGFAAPGFSWTKGSNNNTFGLDDGAVYLSKELTGSEIYVDIPFIGQGGANANFTVGATKAQAYINTQYENGMFWKLGQFDTYLGHDANDLVDNRFSRQGALDSFVPNVHTGLAGGFDLEPLLFELMVANPADQGQVNGSVPDFGGRLGFRSKMLKTSLGFLQNQKTGGSSSITYLDYLLEITRGACNIDLEVLYRKTAGSTGLGWGLFYGHMFTDTVSAGLRAELLGRMGGNHQTVALTAGPQLTVTDDLKIKPDYTFTATKVSAASDAGKGHSAHIAAVYAF